MAKLLRECTRIMVDTKRRTFESSTYLEGYEGSDFEERYFAAKEELPDSLKPYAAYFAEAWMKTSGGGEVYIPSVIKPANKNRDSEIVTKLKDGQTIPEVSREYGLSDRQIRNIKRKTEYQKKRR